MAHTVDARAQNPANALRTELDLLERRAVKPDASTIEPFLLQLDDVERRFDELQADGLDLRSERVRWENVLRRLNSHPNLIARAADGVGGLNVLRTAHPPAESFWWHADKARARRVRRTLIELAAILGGIVVAGLVIYWAVTYLFPPDPETIAVMQATTTIERAIQAGEWDAALAHARDEASTRPNNVEMAMWVAVLAERTGAEVPADTAATVDQLMHSDPLRYWLLRGETSLRLDDPTFSMAAGQEALQIQPNSAEAHFLLGRAAAFVGDRTTALDHLLRAADLAEEDNPQLSVSARILWGSLIQSPAMPDSITTPSPTP